VYVTRITEPRAREQCRGKAIRITYSQCVSVALVIQHSKCMRRITSPVASPAVLYISTLSHKSHDLRKIATENKMHILISCKISSETFLL